MGKIIIQLNFFGPYLKKEDIKRITDSRFSNTLFSHQVELFGWFFELPMSALSEEILERYVEITTEESHTAVVPHTKEIFERLLKPLRSAKKCYCLGDYAATIALCGTVGEMLAILLWKINEVKFKGNYVTEEDEKGIFGSSFEKLGQERRLRILMTFGHITPEQLTKFDIIRNSRKPYLHLWTTDLKNEQAVASNVFMRSFQLFMEVTGIGLADAGTVKINPLLMKLFENMEEKD